jgi:antitoxin CcdA
MTKPCLSQTRPKTRVSITVDEALVAQAKAVGINLSAVAEAAIRNATRAEEMRLWNKRNQEAIEAWTRKIEEEGLWSDRLRLF